MKAIQNLISACIGMAIVLSMVLPACAAGDSQQTKAMAALRYDTAAQFTKTVTATPTASTVLLNGTAVSFDAYHIYGNNYVKLRDLASALNGTEKQFDVTWDNHNHTINLLSSSAYTVVGGEMTASDGSIKTATRNTSPVYQDGMLVHFTSYTINDNTYFKLRDLGKAFNFGVTWDGTSNRITLDTSTTYVSDATEHTPPANTGTLTIDQIPDHSSVPYVVIAQNIPSFPKEDLSTTSFETYSDLDELGRCGVAFANIGTDIMPTEDRGSIGQVKPSGWHTVKYDIVDGKYLYNRCHLIGYQLSAENANRKNLITGTRYLNTEGMLPFENMVADYVKESNHHVLYRVTPVFEGNNLLASGVQMEGYSVEDQGEGICFNVYVYNVQPGIQINYGTGESKVSPAGTSLEETVADAEPMGEIRGNSNSMIYHCPGQASYDNMADSKYLVVFQREEDAVDAGYRKAKR